MTAACRDGRCERVTFDGVPSFVEALDVPLFVPGLGDITVDVAYGGCYYVSPTRAVRCEAQPESARQVVDAGTAISLAARQSITVQHPEIPEIDFHLVRDADRRRRSGNGCCAARRC